MIVLLLLLFLGKACGVGGMRKRQEPAFIEDRDKPYVCDSKYRFITDLMLYHLEAELAIERSPVRVRRDDSLRPRRP